MEYIGQIIYKFFVVYFLRSVDFSLLNFILVFFFYTTLYFILVINDKINQKYKMIKIENEIGRSGT